MEREKKKLHWTVSIYTHHHPFVKYAKLTRWTELRWHKKTFERLIKKRASVRENNVNIWWTGCGRQKKSFTEQQKRICFFWSIYSSSSAAKCTHTHTFKNCSKISSDDFRLNSVFFFFCSVFGLLPRMHEPIFKMFGCSSTDWNIIYILLKLNEIHFGFYVCSNRCTVMFHNHIDDADWQPLHADPNCFFKFFFVVDVVVENDYDMLRYTRQWEIISQILFFFFSSSTLSHSEIVKKYIIVNWIATCSTFSMESNSDEQNNYWHNWTIQSIWTKFSQNQSWRTRK